MKKYQGFTMCSHCGKYTSRNSTKGASDAIKKGMKKARQKGVVMGRPVKIVNIREVMRFRLEGMSYREIEAVTGVSRTTAMRKLRDFMANVFPKESGKMANMENLILKLNKKTMETCNGKNKKRNKTIRSNRKDKRNYRLKKHADVNNR